jgi:hypothetical protein
MRILNREMGGKCDFDHVVLETEQAHREEPEQVDAVHVAHLQPRARAQPRAGRNGV